MSKLGERSPATLQRDAEVLDMIRAQGWAIEISEIARIRGESNAVATQSCRRLQEQGKIKLISGDETEMFAQAIGHGHAKTGLCSCPQCIQARDKNGAIWKEATK